MGADFDLGTAVQDPDFLLNLLAGFICAAIIGATAMFARLLTQAIQESRGRLSGTWTGFAYDDTGAVTKRDRYKVSHRKDKVTVKGVRLYPQQQHDFEWTLTGIQRDDAVMGYFASDNPEVKSLGVIYLLCDRASKRLQGYYMSAKQTGGGGSNSFVVRPVRYEWVRGEHETPPAEA